MAKTPAKPCPRHPARNRTPAGLCLFEHNSRAHVTSIAPLFVEVENPEARTLLNLACSGDGEAFCQICRDHESRLLRQSLVLCGNLASAEDLTQETLIEAWRSLHRFNGKCQFFTWLCAILLNRYRNSLRQRKPTSFSALNRGEGRELTHAMDLVIDNGASPDQAAQLREQSELVLGCIRVLPARHQQVLYLRFYANDSLEGIAAALNCSLGTVKSRLFRALEKLRRMNEMNAIAEKK
jgi:RNA polymerase sigma-70 factor (ECF subfamily)